MERTHSMRTRLKLVLIIDFQIDSGCRAPGQKDLLYTTRNMERALCCPIVLSGKA